MLPAPPLPLPSPPAAVLFDRDATLVVDVPYNADPERVVPMPGAAALLHRLRAAGVPVGIVSNQSGVARGRISPSALDAVQARVEELLGPFDAVEYCVHDAAQGCGCRKPAPGLVRRACDRLGVQPSQAVVVGDIGSDMEAARRAGAAAILVPTDVTRAQEVQAAPRVAADLDAVGELLGLDSDIEAQV